MRENIGGSDKTTAFKLSVKAKGNPDKQVYSVIRARLTYFGF